MRPLALLRLAWRSAAAAKGRTAVTVLGVALGVAVSLAIRVANESVLASFRQSLEAVAGRATLQVTAGEPGVDERLFRRDLGEALSDPKDAWFAIKSALAKRAPERPVEELEIELVGLSAESGKQASMFEGKGKLWRQVEEAVRQMGVQAGGRPATGRVMEVEPWSRIPERRMALVDFDV